MLWPPPVNLTENPEWWERFWDDQNNDGFGKPSDGLLKWIPPILPTTAKTAIDIASGNGRYATELAVRGYDTTALELSESGASRIRGIADKLDLVVEVEVGDFLRLGATGRSYDVIVCSGLLEEIPVAAYPTAIAGLANWSSPGATVINRYCLEIEGRGIFVENGYVPSLYEDGMWDILHEEELKTLKTSKGGFDIRHGTMVARRRSHGR